MTSKPEPTMTDMGPEYKGWTNLETFTVAMFWAKNEKNNTWINQLANNDIPGYPHAVAQANNLEFWTTQHAHVSHTSSFTYDLLTAALARVNYREIIELQQQEI